MANKSARLFRERAGLQTTWREPLPAHSPELHPAHTLPLTVPLPPPEFIVDGAPAPDRGRSALWPAGAAGSQSG